MQYSAYKICIAWSVSKITEYNEFIVPQVHIIARHLICYKHMGTRSSLQVAQNNDVKLLLNLWIALGCFEPLSHDSSAYRWMWTVVCSGLASIVPS